MPNDLGDQTTFHVDTFPLKHWELDNCGFLRFIAPIAKEGNLIYLVDGKESAEYVPAKTLTDSANTFKTKPITKLHPEVRVTPKNAREHARGMTGNQWLYDGSFLWMTGTVIDAELIESIKTKKTPEISPGYDALVKQDSKGMRWQADRDGNHLAAVPRGRAGRDVKFRLDSEDATEIQVSYLALDLEEKDLPDPPEQFLDFLKTDSKTIIDMGSGRKTEPPKDVIEAITMPVQILLDERIYVIDGDDAADLRDAVAAFAKEIKDARSTLDVEKVATTAQLAENERLIADKTRMDAELTATKAKLVEAEKERETKDDGEDVESLINDRLAVWGEVAGYFRKKDSDYKLEFKLSPVEIKYLYLKDATDKKPEYVAIADDLKSMTDLKDNITTVKVDTYYSVLKPKSSDSTSHADDVLNQIKSGRILSRTDDDNSGHEDRDEVDPESPREKAKKLIESRARGRSKTS